MSTQAPVRPPDAPAYGDAVAIVRTLRTAGHEAYLAGGCVRDMVLGLPPKDYDVATSASPAAVQALFPSTHPVGAAFGVVLVVRHGVAFEVATFRADGAYHDGRRPSSVDFGASARADVERRDFTLNALLFDPEGGAVLDHVGGRADIAARVIRAVGEPERRFAEDRLRLLRAVRFACRFGFAIEPGTLAAVRAHADAVHDVSAERIREELTAMWTGPAPRRALALLRETGLLRAVLPEIDALAGVAQPPETHPEGDVLTHTGLLLDGLPERTDPVLAWGALLHDVGKSATAGLKDGRITFHRHEHVGAEMADAIARRLRFSNEHREGAVELVREHMRFFAAPRMRESTLRRFLRAPDFAQKLALHRADLLASNKDLTTWTFCRDRLAALPPAQLRPEPLLRGEDVIALGVPRGPRVGATLRALEDAQLEGRITTRDEAAAVVAALLAGGEPERGG